MADPILTASFAVRDYDLAATLSCGQAFRWKRSAVAWEGVIASRWVRLSQNSTGLLAESCPPTPSNLPVTRPTGSSTKPDWRWLEHYLQLDVDLGAVLASFPDDEPMRQAVAACRGLRLLRQEPWECLASFILSSTKQIVQIQQIIRLLCERFGEPVSVPPGQAAVFAFPSAERLASLAERELRDCKAGFRAPHLLRAAQAVAAGELNLDRLGQLPVDEAREELLRLRGVGEKIANCVLLFAYGFQSAFPVDVWVMRALRQLYFPRRRPTTRQLREFTATHFGDNAGYAQQYLFHYVRLTANKAK